MDMVLDITESKTKVTRLRPGYTVEYLLTLNDRLSLQLETGLQDGFQLSDLWTASEAESGLNMYKY